MYEFSLPENATIVADCHLAWIQDFLPYLERTALQRAANFKEYLKLLMKEEVANQVRIDEDGNGEEIDEEDSTTDNCHTPSGYMGMQLTVIAFHTYLGDFDAARNILNELRRTVKGFPETEHRGMENGFNYCSKAAEWQINVLDVRRDEICKDENEISKQIRSDAVDLVAKWNNLNNTDNQFKATISFFKGCLASGLKIKNEKVLNNFIDSTRLDPECHLWFHYAYRKARRIRRCDPREDAHRYPSRQEEEFCESAVALCPTHPVVMLDYAMLCKDKLWYQVPRVWYGNRDQVQECLDAFGKLFEASQYVDMWNKEKWIRKAKVFYAEFLLFGKDRSLDRQRGKDLLESCLEQYPKSTSLLHKIAKLYHRGTYRDNLFKDHDKALNLYLRALESSQTNYPCLMDFLDFLCEQKQYQQMVHVIDNFLAKSISDVHNIVLSIRRGFIIWIFNPFRVVNAKIDACKVWLYVLNKYPGNTKDVFEAIKMGAPFSAMHNYQRSRYSYSIKSNVIEVLEELKTDCSDGDEFVVIQTFIEELRKPVDSNDDNDDLNNNDNNSPVMDWLVNRMNGVRVTPSLMPEISNNIVQPQPFRPVRVYTHPNARQRRPPSQADDDNNWRG